MYVWMDPVKVKTSFLNLMCNVFFIIERDDDDHCCTDESCVCIGFQSQPKGT